MTHPKDFYKVLYSYRVNVNGENFQQTYFPAVSTPVPLGILRQICTTSHRLVDEAAKCFLDSTSKRRQAGRQDSLLNCTCNEEEKAFPRLETNRLDLAILPETEPV